MGEKIIVGPIGKGLKNDVKPFNIDNDSFPVLINAYQWRGRVLRKRGTSNLSRLMRYFSSTNVSYSSTSTITLNGSGAGNLITGFSLETDSSIVPGSVTITRGGNNYTDPSMDGTLSPSGTINYSSGAIVIAAEAGNAVSAIFRYYPTLPVMGLEDFDVIDDQFPDCIAFDTKYSYNIIRTAPFNSYNVSFYKNLPTATYAGYTQKTNPTPVTWNGQDYQQFWSANYQNALWVTNGVTVPFVATNIGMPFAIPSATTRLSATTMQFTIVGNPLVVGDFVFVNEFVGSAGGDEDTLNFLTGFVTVAGNAFTVTFPNANITAGTYTGGMVQYLTNRSDVTKDCIRWYDGDPTNGSATSPVLNGTKGWVNFCPPLSRADYSIADLPLNQYYLVGAKMIVPFKDRLLFLGVVVQASTGDPVYLQDTIVYSQNGTPYYTATFSTDPSLPTTIFNSILVPDNQTAFPPTFWGDQTGFGGWISAGLNQAIISCSTNEDALIVGFTGLHTRVIYTGNDLLPFNFYIINSEYGSGSTFSTINMDKGSLTRGSRGYVVASQTSVQRFDLDIPDEVYQIKLNENGFERVCAQRDFINEWVYFTYPSNSVRYKFPNTTLFYNYRDQSWAQFTECYTTYGQFKKIDGFTWATIGTLYPTWSSWNIPWNAGTSTPLQPNVIGGNQQGFVIVKDEGTNEAKSLAIQDISGNTVTSPDHCLNKGDYIIISDAIGTVASQVNGNIFSVASATTDTFTLNPSITGGTYLGLGLIKRLYVPFIMTKQFPPSWGMARKTRIGPQQYLFSTTANAQIQLLIFLSQNMASQAQDFATAYNIGPIVPDPLSVNNSLIYSTVLYTCPESTNLGLTPANVNLNIVTAQQNAQTWHRMNTSLIGDTVQIGFTMSDEQMRDTDFNNQFAEIELHGFILDVNPSQLLV